MSKVRKNFLALIALKYFCQKDREFAASYTEEALELYNSLTEKQKEKLYKEFCVDLVWINENIA